MKDFTTIQTFPIPETQSVLQERVTQGQNQKKVLIVIIGALTVTTIVILSYALHQKARIKRQNESE